jgi:hypothetical protein
LAKAASPIGFPRHCGMKRIKSLVIKGLAQIACQSQATHLGNAGLHKLFLINALCCNHRICLGLSRLFFKFNLSPIAGFLAD